MFLSSFVIFLCCSCSPKNKLEGKWQFKKENDSSITTETCEFMKNNTETCFVDFEKKDSNTKVSYVTTQEWQIDGNKLVEKNIDAKVLKITLDGEDLQPMDREFQNFSIAFLSEKPVGLTASRQIYISQDYFELREKDGSARLYYKAN
jgi:hypothetical protein